MLYQLARDGDHNVQEAAITGLTATAGHEADSVYLAALGLSGHQVSLAAAEAYRTLGSPEGELALAHAAVYLATAPKSNRVYTAWKRATADVEAGGSHPVPLHLRNAPTRLMRDLGYGKEYRYPHDFADAFVPENYFPETLGRRRYYDPSDAGHEKVIAERLKAWWGKK